MEWGEDVTEIEPLLGWAALVSVVIAYDTWAFRTGHSTLSMQFRRWVQNLWWFRLGGAAGALLLFRHLFLGREAK